ncbi:MAG TPA: TolC family protein [bacterium]|nr:TolC family protein [bacterium]HPJ71383.1 TolC family protein [bacterium]HPQ65421.1 TolC family protein [bacterium]
MKIALTIGLCLLVGSAGRAAIAPAPSPTVPVYTLADCLEMAYERNAQIETAAEEMEAAGGIRLQAISDAVPHLSGDASYTYLDRIRYYESGDETLPVNRHDNYHVGLTLEQSVYQGGRVIAGIRAADLLNDYSEVYLAETRMDVAYRVKEFFYLLLQQEEVARIRRDTVKHMTDYRDTAENKFEQGTISEFDRITAEVKLANSVPPMIQAENQTDIYKTSLARELGLSEQTFGVHGRLEYVDFDVPLESLNILGKEYRPLLKQMRLMEEMREQEVNAARAGYQPSVSLFASWVGDYPDDETPPESDFQNEWFAGARLTWHLFDGLKTPGKVAEARARLNQARIASSDAERTVLLAIKQAYLDTLASRKALESQKETVAQAEKAYQIAKIRWDNGISTSLELTDAELNLSEARVMFEQSLAYYRISLAAIERSVGVPLEEMKRVGPSGGRAPMERGDSGE